MANTIIEFDRTQEYEDAILDHINEISNICSELHLPFFFSVCVSNTKNDDGTYTQKYKRVGRTPASYNFSLPGHDEVAKHYSVSLGARVISDVAEDLGESYMDHSKMDEVELFED